MSREILRAVGSKNIINDDTDNEKRTLCGGNDESLLVPSEPSSSSSNEHYRLRSSWERFAAVTIAGVVLLAILSSVIALVFPKHLELGFDGSDAPSAATSAVDEDASWSGAVYSDVDGRKKDGGKDGYWMFADRGYSWARLGLLVDCDNEEHGQRHLDGLKELSYLAKRIHGLKLLVDIHYSDVAADAGNQLIPTCWESDVFPNGRSYSSPTASKQMMNITALEQHIYDYTLDVIRQLHDQGTPPDAIQLGHAVNSGMLEMAGNVTDSWDISEWKGFVSLTQVARQAVYDGFRDNDNAHDMPKIVMHLDAGGFHDISEKWFRSFFDSGGKCDVIGLSYFPWHHGSFEALSRNINNLATKFRKELWVVETAYYWDSSLVRSADDLPYPETKNGQLQFLRGLRSALEQTKCSAVFYWGSHSTGQGANGVARDGVVAEATEANDVARRSLFDRDGRALVGIYGLLPHDDEDPSFGPLHFPSLVFLVVVVLALSVMGRGTTRLQSPPIRKGIPHDTTSETKMFDQHTTFREVQVTTSSPASSACGDCHCHKLTVFHAEPLAMRDETGLKPVTLLNLQREKEALIETFRDATEAGAKAEIGFETGTSSRLVAYLAAASTAHGVLHLSCHGVEDHLCLEDHCGGVHFVRSDELEQLVSKSERHLRFVFVAACWSYSVGEAFVKAGAEHVLCCRAGQSFEDGALVEFSRAFYLALACGRTLQKAFDLGIQALLISPVVHDPDAEANKFVLLPENIDHDVAIFAPVREKFSPRSKGDISLPPELLLHPRHNVRGNELDLYKVLRGLRRERLVCISGAGGSNKVSLAAAACRYVSSRNRMFSVDEIIWLPKSSAWEQDLLAFTCQRLFSAVCDKTRDDNHRIVCNFRQACVAFAALLEGRRALLVIDGRQLQGQSLSRLSTFLAELLSNNSIKIILLSRHSIQDFSCVATEVLLGPA